MYRCCARRDTIKSGSLNETEKRKNRTLEENTKRESSLRVSGSDIKDVLSKNK